MPLDPTTTKKMKPHHSMSERLRIAYPMLYQEEGRKKDAHHQVRDPSIIGRSYRQYLGRQYSRSLLTWATVARRLFDDCATLLTAGARGRLGRRRARTCGYLEVLQDTDLSLVQRILGRPKKKSWYNTASQLKKFDNDYLETCLRRAFVPPRFVVEAAIADIAEKITKYKHRVVTVVQSRWRGITVRRFFDTFQFEKKRRIQRRAAAALKLSPLFRSCLALRRLRSN